MSTELFDLASEARALFEKRLVPRELLGQLYAEYNPDIPDARGFLEAAEHFFPRLNCGLATVYLAFRYDGPSEIMVGTFDQSPHTFLKIGELIVDITADQYSGGPQRFVGQPTQQWVDKPGLSI